MASVEETRAGEVSLIYVIGRVNHGIRKELRRHLLEWQLSVPEFTALSILRRRPGLSNAQLARRSIVTPQSMIEILAGLESRGLVERTIDPQHGRILRAELTAEGLRVVTAAQRAVDEVQDELLEGVPADQRQLVLDVMIQAMQRLRQAH